MNEKQGVVRYVNFIKKLFIAFSAIAIPVLFVCMFFAVQGYTAFWFLAPAVAVVYFVLYGLYAMKILMGTAIGYQIVGSSVRVYTKRKMFLYDLKGGEVVIKEKTNKFIVTLYTETERDSFVFYRRVAFTPYHEEQFTKDDMQSIYSVSEGEN